MTVDVEPIVVGPAMEQRGSHSPNDAHLCRSAVAVVADPQRRASVSLDPAQLDERVEDLRLTPAVVRDSVPSDHVLPSDEVTVRKHPTVLQACHERVQDPTRPPVDAEQEPGEVDAFGVVVKIALVERDARAYGERDRLKTFVQQVRR